MLDSLKHVKTLEDSGFSRKQAESQVQVLANVLGGNMVTKDEFSNAKEEFRNALSELRKDVKLDMADLRQELKSDIAESEQRMTITLGKMMAFHFMATIGILALVLPFALKYALK